MLENALKLFDLNFLALVPAIACPAKTMNTPLTPSSQANLMLSARFFFASVTSSISGFCEPVRMIGFAESCIRYERAAAVYAIVSVP